MPWVCLPVGRIKHLAPAALAALIAAHPIPAGVACYCSGTSLAYVPGPGDHGASPHEPGKTSAQSGVPNDIPDVPLPSGYSPPFGWHGPDWTPPVLFIPIGVGGYPGDGPYGGGYPVGGIPGGFVGGGPGPGGGGGGGGGGGDGGGGGGGGGGPGGEIPPPHGGGGSGNVPPPPQNVPEPASGALFLMAIAALAGLRTRERRGRARRPAGGSRRVGG